MIAFRSLRFSGLIHAHYRVLASQPTLSTISSHAQLSINNDLIKLEESIPKINALDKVDESNVDLINNISPSLKKSFNLAAYVNVSETLQQLIKLNVDLSKFDKDTDLASFVLKCDFKTNIEPLIMFLLNNGVDIKHMGDILTKNPYLMMAHLDDLQVRVNYLKFRKFNKAQIVSMWMKAPGMFSLAAKTIDARLGNLLQEYKLSANDVRYVVAKYPRIIFITPQELKKLTFMFGEQMGLSREEIKSVLLRYPVLWRKANGRESMRTMTRTFDYVHNQMGLEHELIVRHIAILNTRINKIRARHLYLKTLNRAQYDPTKPLFVPLNAFYTIDDAEFCLKYAKTTVNDFNLFLKTI